MMSDTHPFRLLLATAILVSGMLNGLVVASEETTPIASGDRNPVPLKEYGKWERLGRGGTLSPDGNWLVYPIQRNNDKNELRLHDLSADTLKVLAQGSDQRFSKDSRWLGYLIQVSAK